MEEKDSLQSNGVDIQEKSQKIFMCMFHDLPTLRYGINIATPSESFVFMLEYYPSAKQAGGELTMKKARALRDFLNNLLDGKI